MIAERIEHMPTRRTSRRNDQEAYYQRFILGGVNEEVCAQTMLQVMLNLETTTSVTWPAASLLGFRCI